MDIKLKFANIQGWMYDYCDNLREVVALSIIYGFSQDEESSFHGSLQYLQQLLLCSKPTVIETLKSLEDKGLIIKKQKIINSVTFNEYKAVLPVVKEFYHPSKNSLPNNNICNNTPNNPTLFDNKDSVISPKGDRSKDIEERRAKFHESLRPYIQEYGEDMIIAFYNYWVEKNPKGTKMRFEMEKTFEISRRLSTWKRNEEERKFRRR